MKFLFAMITFSVFISTAYAQYTCNDRNYLRSALAQLEYNCGSSDSNSNSNSNSISICTAFEYKGSTIESTIENCVSSGWNRKNCNQALKCSTGMTICSAMEYKGSTIESAIASCVNSGWNRKNCNQSAACARN